MEIKEGSMSNNIELSNIKETFKYESIQIPPFSCAQWKKYKEESVQSKPTKKKGSRQKASKTKAAGISADPSTTPPAAPPAAPPADTAVVPPAASPVVPLAAAPHAPPPSALSSPAGMIRSDLKENTSTVISKKLLSKVRDSVLMDKIALRKNLSKKSSIEDDLANMFLKVVMEENKKKDQNFIQCNLVERLVDEKNLSYLHLKQYPDMFIVSIQKPDMDESSTKQVQFLKDSEGYGDILFSVDNEEIPVELFFIFENYCDVFVYNIHVILKHENFTSANVEPYLSTFVVLKPTDIVLNILLKEIIDQINNERKGCPAETELYFEMSASLEDFKNSISQEEVDKTKQPNKKKRKSTKESEKQNKEKQFNKPLNESDAESKFCFIMSGPLYLEANETPVLGVINLFSLYKTSFESKSLSSETRSNIIPEVWQENTFLDTYLKTSFKYITLSSQETELNEFLYLGCPPTVPFTNCRDILKYHMILTDMNENHVLVSNRRLNMKFVEIFSFIIKQDIKKDYNEYSVEVDVCYKLQVFQKNGLYYMYLSEETENQNEDFMKDIVPHNIMNTSCIGSRKRLEMFILNFAEMLSERYKKYLMIKYQYSHEIDEERNVIHARNMKFYVVYNYQVELGTKPNNYEKLLNTETEPSCEPPDSSITAADEMHSGKNNLAATADDEDIPPPPPPPAPAAADGIDEDIYAPAPAAVPNDDEGCDIDYEHDEGDRAPVISVDSLSTLDMEVILPDKSSTEKSVSSCCDMEVESSDIQPVHHTSSEIEDTSAVLPYDDILSCYEVEVESSNVSPILSSSEVDARSNNSQPSKTSESVIDISHEVEVKSTNVSLTDHILSCSEVEYKQSNEPSTVYALSAYDYSPSSSDETDEPFNMLTSEYSVLADDYIPPNSEVDDGSPNHQPQKIFVPIIDLSSDMELESSNVSLADQILASNEVEHNQSNVPTTVCALSTYDCIPSNCDGADESFNVSACDNQDCLEIPSKPGSSINFGEQLSYEQDGQLAISHTIQDTSSDESQDHLENPTNPGDGSSPPIQYISSDENQDSLEIPTYPGNTSSINFGENFSSQPHLAPPIHPIQSSYSDVSSDENEESTNPQMSSGDVRNNMPHLQSTASYGITAISNNSLFQSHVIGTVDQNPQMSSDYVKNNMPPLQSAGSFGITMISNNSLYQSQVIGAVDQNQLSLMSTAGYSSFISKYPVSNDHSLYANQMNETSSQNSEQMQLASSIGYSSHFTSISSEPDRQGYGDSLCNVYRSQSTANISENPQHMQPASSSAFNSQSAEPGFSAESNRQDGDSSSLSPHESEPYGGQATLNTGNCSTEPTEAELSSKNKTTEPFISVYSVVERNSVKTVFQAYEFESDASISQIHLTKKDVEKEISEIYPSLKKEFKFKPSDINHYIGDFHRNMKFEQKEIDALSEQLKFLCDVFKPRSVRKGSTMCDL